MKREELQRLTEKFKATHDLSLEEFESITAAVVCEPIAVTIDSMTQNRFGAWSFVVHRSKADGTVETYEIDSYGNRIDHG